MMTLGIFLLLSVNVDESGSDSDGLNSSSSSYSSLSDFVIDIQNSDINGDTPGLWLRLGIETEAVVDIRVKFAQTLCTQYLNSSVEIQRRAQSPLLLECHGTI